MEVTSDPIILSHIKGLKIPFNQVVYQHTVPTEPMWSVQEKIAIKTEINHLLEIGAVKKCAPCPGQFISPVFLTPKSDGSLRFILNLKSLNKFITVRHFKLEDRKTVLGLLSKDCFMATLDLQEAYHLVPIRAQHRKFLRFIFNAQIYEFSCLPFGLNVAPSVFTKIMKPVVSYLRSRGFSSVVYLDDFLLISDSYSACQLNITETILLLQKLGFVINHKKSNLTPSQNCKYLGFYYNSSSMTLELPQEKRVKIKKLITKFRSIKLGKIREFAHFLGLLTSASPAVAYGWVYTKTLERLKTLALLKSNGDYDQSMNLDQSIHEDLTWWHTNIVLSKNKIRSNSFMKEIFTDASKTGWGAVCGGERAFGFWSNEEKILHINELELLAAFFGLKCFAAELYNCEVLLRVDNTTAIAYINRMGGTRFSHLNNISKSIWQWCEKRKIYVFVSYIESSVNKEADRESRRLKTETEWQLADEAYIRIIETFGEPEIDLFADRNNTKCKKFVSWQRDPESITVDAFTIPWDAYAFYAFPPFSLILRVLRKISNEKSEGIVVVPYWPTQPWFPLYSSLLVTEPIFFRPAKNLLLSSDRSHHPLWKHLTLVASRLSGKPSKRRAYHFPPST